jgi:hypothetical protein
VGKVIVLVSGTTGTTVMEDIVTEQTIILMSLKKTYDRNSKFCAYILDDILPAFLASLQQESYRV